MGSDGQGAVDRRAGGQRSANRCDLRSPGWRNNRRRDILLRLRRRIPGSQVHASHGKCCVWNRRRQRGTNPATDLAMTKRLIIKNVAVLHHRAPAVRDDTNWRSARVRVP